MSLEELEQYQYEKRVDYLASLFRNAAQKFLDAARLLEIRSPTISKLQEAKVGSVEVTPLLPLYGVINKRYNNAFFSPQVDWVQPKESRADIRWGRYYTNKLVPKLLEDDEFVRNILRVMEALPCRNMRKVRAALVSYCEEITFPDTRPLWGASPLLGDDSDD